MKIMFKNINISHNLQFFLQLYNIIEEPNDILSAAIFV